MESVLLELKKDYKGKADIKAIDANEHIELSMKYRIRAVPTIIFLDEKGTLIDRVEGKMTRAEIEEVFKKIGVK